MELGKIYKYTNLLDGKVYIGQTRTSLEKRDRRHQNQVDDNTYFHRALKKYGRNNFSLELVEDNIPLEKLDEKEKYYIDFFESFYTLGKGYNLTQGGQWRPSNQKITIGQANEIKALIAKNTMGFKEIGNLYNVSLYCISDINRGRTFWDENTKYPIRQAPTKSYIDEEKIEIILSMLLSTNMTQEEIALATDIHSYTVGEINRGSNSWCPKDLGYPLRKPVQASTYQNVINLEDVRKICYKLCFTNETLKDIGKEFGIAKNTVGDISRGISWKQITSQFVCPIRKNKLENQEIYKSIYGIV